MSATTQPATTRQPAADYVPRFHYITTQPPFSGLRIQIPGAPATSQPYLTATEVATSHWAPVVTTNPLFETPPQYEDVALQTSYRSNRVVFVARDLASCLVSWNILKNGLVYIDGCCLILHHLSNSYQLKYSSVQDVQSNYRRLFEELQHYVT